MEKTSVIRPDLTSPGAYLISSLCTMSWSSVTSGKWPSWSVSKCSRSWRHRSQKPRVRPCEPLCAILLAKARVYPLSPVKTNVNRLCECDLKPLWKGLSPCRMGRTFSVFQADQAVSGGKQDSRRSLLKRTLRRLCRRC